MSIAQRVLMKTKPFAPELARALSLIEYPLYDKL
jgi:hypothetical protein